MKKRLFFIAAVLGMILIVSCEKYPDCPKCVECELEHLGQNSEWGEVVRAELTSLFFDIEDLALLRVYNTSGDVCHWSGFDAGNPMEDSRQIQVDFLETELILIWKRFVDGKWTHSLIKIRYDFITTAVLQNVSFISKKKENVGVWGEDEFIHRLSKFTEENLTNEQFGVSELAGKMGMIGLGNG